MVQVDLQWLKGSQFFDANGDPLSGGKLYFFDTPAGPARTTYSDADGTVPNTTPIVLDSGGYLQVSVYIQVGRWDFRLDDQNDVEVYSEQNIQGALDADALQVVSARPEMPVINVTSNYTVQAADLGGTINADPTGGTITLSLLSAATAGDGKTLAVKHVGTANEVVVSATGGQTIDGQTTYVLTEQQDMVWVVSDGANWHVIGSSRLFAQYPFPVVERRVSPPGSFNAGDNFIINGTPNGDWSTFAENDVVKASGTGLWQNFTPPTDSGWLGYVQAENLLVQFRDSAWVDLSNITAPAASALKVLVAQNQKTDGTSGGATTATAWTLYPFNTELVNTVPGASLASDQFTLPAGDYRVFVNASLAKCNTGRLRIYDTTNTATALLGNPAEAEATGIDQVNFIVQGTLSPAAETVYEVQYYIDRADGDGLGLPAPDSEQEVYSTITILDLAAQQGPQGPAGPQGADGAAGSSDVTGTSATSNTIGTGAKTWTVAEASRGWEEGARLRATSRANPTGDYMEGEITSYAGTALTVQVDYVPPGAAAGPFSDWNFNLAGDPGEAGAAGPIGPNLGLDYAWDTATADEDPGSGNVRASAAPAESTSGFLYISKIDRNSNDKSVQIARWDDSTTVDDRGAMFIRNTADAGQDFSAVITGALIDATTYYKVPITFGSVGNTLPDAAVCGISFSRTGDKGSDGTGTGDVTGPSSSTSKAIARYADATGKVIDEPPANAPTIDDGGAIDQTATSATRIPAGTTAQQPAHGDGKFRLNLTTGTLEYSLGGTWTVVAVVPIKEASIDDGAVTNPKLADMVQNRIKGRVATGTGDPEDLTAAQVLTILDTAANPPARLDSNQTFTKGQRTQVTALATWTTGWNIDDSNDFRITGLVSGAAGDFPLPTATGLAANEVQKGEIKFNSQAGTTAGFNASWEWPGGSAGIPNIGAGGHWTLYYRIENDGSTTHYEIAAVDAWATA